MLMKASGRIVQWRAAERGKKLVGDRRLAGPNEGARDYCGQTGQE
jgi:hypothetical protein